MKADTLQCLKVSIGEILDLWKRKDILCRQLYISAIADRHRKSGIEGFIVLKYLKGVELPEFEHFANRVDIPRWLHPGKPITNKARKLGIVKLEVVKLRVSNG